MRVLTRRGDLMGGVLEIVAVGASERVVARVERLLTELAVRWSRFDPRSDVVRLNDAAGAMVEVHPATAELVARLAGLHQETGGAFDPTRLPDLVAAGYTASRVDGTAAPDLPATARAGGSLCEVRVEATSVALPTGMTLDFGGVAKGHAASLAATALIEDGARGALVSVAGDLAVDGENAHGGPWRIGVEDPADPSQRVAVVELDRGAVATSSRVKRSWVGDGGIRQHHLIDPRTGSPATGPVLTATVVAADGARAEAWAKGGFVHGDFLERAEAAGLPALVVLDSGSVRTTAIGRWS